MLNSVFSVKDTREYHMSFDQFPMCCGIMIVSDFPEASSDNDAMYVHFGENYKWFDDNDQVKQEVLDWFLEQAEENLKFFENDRIATNCAMFIASLANHQLKWYQPLLEKFGYVNTVQGQSLKTGRDIHLFVKVLRPKVR